MNTLLLDLVTHDTIIWDDNTTSEYNVRDGYKYDGKLNQIWNLESLHL